MNRAEWIKIAKGAGVAAAGALATYVTAHAADVNLGDWTPLVVAAFSVLANVLRKALGG